MNPRILLIMIDWFDPAYKAGGPIRTAVNLAKQLSGDFIIYILTSDRDLNDDRPLDNISSDCWLEYDRNVSVMYLSNTGQTWSNIRAKIEGVGPDVIYCNGMYSRYFTIYPILLRGIGVIDTKIVVGPHGMLKPSALRYKSLKKKLFLTVLRMSGMQKKVNFHATDNEEVQDIRGQFGDVSINAVMDMPAPLDSDITVREKEILILRVIFIGRIHPIKQLDLVLKVLAKQDSKIELTIVGTIEDEAYWDMCENLIKRLPNNIKVSYLGEVRHEDVKSVIEANHVLFLPTRGENFGHVIFESLALGKPVIISDQTPWRDLELHKAGWDISLSDFRTFCQVVDKAAKWDDIEYAQWAKGAFEYVKIKVNHRSIIEGYKKLFA